MGDSILTDFRSCQLVQLNIDDISIALPQTNVVYIENSSQVSADSDCEKISGQLQYNSASIDVYTLNSQLELLPVINSQHKICAILQTPDKIETIALMCNTLEKYSIGNKIPHSDIPKIMRRQASPIIGFTKNEEQLILLCNIESLISYFKSNEVISQRVLANA